MTRRALFRETAEVRASLVAELAHTHVPTGIMGLTLVGVSLFTYSATGLSILLAAALWGGLACAIKLCLMSAHARMKRNGSPTRKPASYWETAHALTTAGMASSIGTVSCALFCQDDIHLQLLATGLLFGYGAGIVGRTALRPMIATFALLVSAVPTIIVAARWPDTSHQVIALIFGGFLLGALDSIRHVHRTAARHVAMQLEMARLARHDPLTGLLNRRGLREAFQRFSPRPGTSLAIHCLDLDGFKTINDRYGHAAGDGVLVELARRLSAEVPPDALVARMGGDEFVVMQWNVMRREEAEALAALLHGQVREPFRNGDRSASVGVSLGYALAPATEPDFERLLRRADEASYRIKRTGGGFAASVAEPPSLLDVA